MKWGYVTPEQVDGTDHRVQEALIRCATLPQKWNMLRRNRRVFRAVTDFLSRKGAESLFASVSDLRNLIAHGHGVTVLTEEKAEGAGSNRSNRRELWARELYGLVVQINQMTELLSRVAPPRSVRR